MYIFFYTNVWASRINSYQCYFVMADFHSCFTLVTLVDSKVIFISISNFTFTARESNLEQMISV